MCNWGFQAKVAVVKDNLRTLEWRWIRPTGGRPYQFPTEEKAEATRRMCHPGLTSEQSRVYPVGADFAHFL